MSCVLICKIRFAHSMQEKEKEPAFELCAGRRDQLGPGMVWRATYGSFVAWVGRRMLGMSADGSTEPDSHEGWKPPYVERIAILENLLQICEQDAACLKESASNSVVGPICALLDEPGWSQLKVLAAKTLAVVSTEASGSKLSDWRLVQMAEGGVIATLVRLLRRPNTSESTVEAKEWAVR
eukprot:SAG31_NODE_2334_length_5929_cov_1.453516_4_plen_181_part_00